MDGFGSPLAPLQPSQTPGSEAGDIWDGPRRGSREGVNGEEGAPYPTRLSEVERYEAVRRKDAGKRRRDTLDLG